MINKKTKVVMYLLLVGVVIYILSQLNLYQILQSIWLLQIWQWLIWFTINILFLLISAWRWQYFLAKENVFIATKNILGHRLAGFALSYFTPGPQFGGEPLQIYLLLKHDLVPTDIASTSVVLDRLIDTFYNFLVLIVGCSYIYCFQTNLQIPIFSWFLPILLASLLAFIFYCYHQKYQLLFLTTSFFPLPSKVRDYIFKVEEKMISLLSQKLHILILPTIYSCTLWVITFLELWLTFYFLGYTLSFNELIILLITNRIALLMPSPGGMGTIEASQYFVLQTLNISLTIGFAAIALMRFRDILSSIAGIVWLNKIKPRLS